MPVIGERLSISLEKILFATDFSLASARAGSYVKALSQRFSSSVEILNAFNPSTVTSYEEAELGLPAENRRKHAMQRLVQLQNEFVASGVRSEVSLPDSHHPANAIVAQAKEWEADVIVAATDAKAGLERIVMGSTAEALIRSAHCPVLTVGPLAKPAPGGPLVFRNIVFATDFSPEAAKAAMYALAFAQDSGARLFYCFVLGGGSHNAELSETLDKGFTEALKQLIPEGAYDWCSPEAVVEHGDAAPGILGLAERVHADLIVLGARSSSFWLSYGNRGLAPKLFAAAQCPVLTVR